MTELNSEQISQFNDSGYLILRKVIPDELLNDALNEVELLLLGQWQSYWPDISFPGTDQAMIELLNRNNNYRRVLYEWINKRMLTPQDFARFPLVKTVMKNLGMVQPVFQMAAHRVNLPMEDHFLTEWPQDIGIMNSENSLTMWLPLKPTNHENGSIALLAGSHKAGVIEPYRNNYRGHSEIDPKILAAYPQVWESYSPGDLLVFHTKTIHNAMPNRSEGCRWAVIFRYEDGIDNKYFDCDSNPLHKGYIMKKTTGGNDTVSGFVEGDAAEDMKDKEKIEVVKAYQRF